jgi:ABC-type lipoprotein export system ATPase subunit
MIELQGVTKVYKAGELTVKAVDCSHFEMNKEEIVVIFGRSGSGKTTFLSLVGGLTKPTTGKVSINGTDIWTLSDKELSAFRNRNMGFVFQFPSLIPTLHATDNLMLPTIFNEKGKEDQRRARARELLERVGLRERMGVYPSQLSGGEQRRIAIARALMNEPQIILADEPTGDLDEETENDIVDLMKQLNQEGTGILMVTHNTDLAGIAQRTFQMASGVLRETKQ